MSKERIVVIEDETDMREELRDLLLYERFEVSCAATAAEGWQLILDEQPDLVSRGRWRANAAQAALLAREAITSLQYKAGAHAIFNDQFLARQFRDVMAGTPHISMDWDVSGTLYGKALLGIDTSKEPLH